MVVNVRLDDIASLELDWVRQEKDLENRSDAIRWCIREASRSIKATPASDERVVESKARPVVSVLMSGMSWHEQEDKLNSFGSLGYRLVSVVSHGDDLVAYLQAD